MKQISFADYKLLSITKNDHEDLIATSIQKGCIDDGDVFRLMVYRNKAVGICSYTKKETDVEVQMFIENMHSQDIRYFIALLRRQIERRFSLATITFTKYPDFAIHALQKNLFFRKGSFYRYKQEPWYHTLPASSFDDFGYLIHQANLSSIPFGYFQTDAKGCGWIAVYNYLKFVGKEMYMCDVVHGLEKGAWFGEIGGESIFRMKRFLKKNGVDTHMVFAGTKKASKYIDESECGIILYRHPKGNHFAFYTHNKDTIHLKNSIYGKKEDIVTFASFIKNRVSMPYISLLYTSKYDTIAKL